MKLLSVNVAQPRRIQIGAREVLTGIYKEPVAGRVRVRQHNLEGDAQADLRVHGGEHKAVYAYLSYLERLSADLGSLEAGGLESKAE